MPIPNLFRNNDDIQDVIKLFQAELKEVKDGFLQQIAELRKENTELRCKIAEIEMSRVDDSITTQNIAKEIEQYVGEFYVLKKEHNKMKERIAGIEFDMDNRELIDNVETKIDKTTEELNTIQQKVNQQLNDFVVKMNSNEEKLFKVDKTTEELNTIQQKTNQHLNDFVVKMNSNEERLLKIEDPTAVIKQRFEHRVLNGITYVKITDFFDPKYSLFKTPFSLEPDPHLQAWLNIPIKWVKRFYHCGGMPENREMNTPISEKIKHIDKDQGQLWAPINASGFCPAKFYTTRDDPNLERWISYGKNSNEVSNYRNYLYLPTPIMHQITPIFISYINNQYIRKIPTALYEYLGNNCLTQWEMQNWVAVD